MVELIQGNIITIISTLFGGGGVIAYLFERRKNKAVTKGVEADANSKEIDNSSKVVDLYKTALNDLENRYEKKYKEITELYERKIKVLQDEIRLHKRYSTSLKRENTELRKRIKDGENTN